MLRTSKTHQGYFQHARSNVGTKKKKYDGDKSKMMSFDYSEIHSAIKNKSIEQLMNHKSGPAILICSICIFITMIYVIIAAFSSSFAINYNKSTEITPEYSNDLIMEIEQVLSKLIQLRQNGNMKDYEAFLQPTMQKYCLDYLGKTFLDIDALESFHMNLANTISFISAGNTFTEHKSLVVTGLGAIIDPPNSTQSDSKTCPMLTALYELGAEKKSSSDKNDEKTKGKKDSDEKFDQKFSWENLDAFMVIMYESMTESGECLRIVREMKKENVKLFILNFYEMADIIGRKTAAEDKEGANDFEYRPDPSSPDYRKYVIGRDGAIYETDKYDDKSDEYLRCSGIEEILNDKFILDDNLSYTNVKISIDERFDVWYSLLLEKIK